MKSNNNTKKINVVLFLALCVLVSSVSYAAPLTNWAAPNVFFGDDPSGEMTIFHTSGNPLRPLLSGEDMIKVFYSFESGIHFFRMDLLAIPEASTYSPEYSIQIDYTAGGLSWGDPAGNDTNAYYVANPLFGIDVILTAHYSNGEFIGVVQRHRHDGSTPSNLDETDLMTLAGGNFQNNQSLAPAGAGATLEWSLAASELNGSGALDPTTMWFVTHDINAGDGGTYDLAIVPEGSTISLLMAGFALFFLVSYGRRCN